MFSGSSEELAAAPGHAADQGVYFRTGFEEEAWWKVWGLAAAPRNCTPAEGKGAFSGKRGLKIRVNQGDHNGTSLEWLFARNGLPEPDEIYFRYYLRFDSNWIAGRGGKMPGFTGTGKVGWGGRKADGVTGWSARGMQHQVRNSARVQLGSYVYHLGQGAWGSEWAWGEGGQLDLDRWYCVEQYVKMNTVGKADGILRAWVDGKQVWERTDIRFRTVPELRAKGVWINVYYGGSWTAPQDMDLYIDDVAIASRPIGPIAKRE